ncbi:MAG: IS66 family transposase [Spirochaetales bacterium]|nr:IS66 family transposase [Spirochaetales bacterium]
MSTETLLKENAELKQIINNQSNQIAELKEQVYILQMLHFGAKSEKLTKEDKKQASLFNEAEDAVFEQKVEIETETIEVKKHTKTVRKDAGRKALSEDLPREIVEYDIDEEDKTCACGTEKVCIGEDVSERVCIVPAKVVVRREIKKKYVCRNCEGTTDDEVGVQTAEGKKHLIGGSIADESLLAWSINEKFEYALPFYRQSKRLSAIGIDIPRATLSTLAIKCAEKCRPLYELLKENIKHGPVINADETRVQVLKEKGRKAQDKSWMWVFLGGEPDKKSVVFQYEKSRSHEIPYDFLQDYEGWLQTDDYEAYHTALKRLRKDGTSSILHVLCWAHARRKFYKYWEMSKSPDAKKILELIKKLFELEDLRADFSRKGFQKQRKNRAGPILQSLFELLTEHASQTPPTLAFGKAISYTLDNWEQLKLYLDDPLLTPSNNSAENAIRPFVIGRKNWLFSDTERGAESSAILYSLVESAKLQKLSVYDYFYYVFRKLPYCESTSDYENLLPFNLTSEQVKS